MKQLILERITALMTFQARLENAGDEKATATTLHLVATLPNTVLDMLEPQLRAAFYRKELKSDEKVDLADAGASPDDGLNRLKFSRIGSAIQWDEVWENYQTLIDYGIANEPVIKLAPCKVDGIQVTLRDGGSVVVKLRVAAHPNEDQAGKLYTLNGSEVTITLQPHSEKAKGQQDLLDGKKK